MSALFAKHLLLQSLLATAVFLSSTVRGAENENIGALFLAINERLGHMEDVALYKAQNQIPVEDIEREKAVLENAKALAAAQGIYAASMERFFAAQIKAAKVIQYRHRAELLIQELPTKTVDLNRQIRPALDSLGLEIVRLFAQMLRAGEFIEEQQSASFLATQSSRHLTEADKLVLFDAMREVRLQ